MSTEKLYIYVGSPSLERRVGDYSRTIQKLTIEIPTNESPYAICDIRGYDPVTTRENKTYFRPILIVVEKQVGVSLFEQKQSCIKFINDRVAPLMHQWGVSDVHVIAVTEGPPRMIA